MIRPSPSIPSQNFAIDRDESGLEAGLILGFHARFQTLMEEATAERREWADELSYLQR
jgi:hypothetical protein